MADEVDIGEVDDLALAPEEGAEQEAPAAPSLEDIARERGWKPKEEWTGASEWKDAAQFITYGLDRARDLGDDVKHLRRNLDKVSKSVSESERRASEAARNEERARWEQMLNVAVEEGDPARAREAAGKISELSVPPTQQRQADPQDEYELRQFVATNPWFQSDPAAQHVALLAAQKVHDRGGTPQEQMRAARDEVFKRFPEHAPQQAKPVQVATPQGRTAARPGGKKTSADLTADELRVAKYLVGQGKIKSVDAYVAQRFNSEGLIE